MADRYRTDDTVVVRRGGAGRTIAIILAIVAIIAVLLFATGFWSADVKEGALPKVNVSTDFVVLGVEPVVPAFTTEELEDPVNKKKLEDAQAEQVAYQDILQTAGELNIPVMNQNRFLYYVGYYDQAKR